MNFQTLRSALRDADAADSTGLNTHYWAVVVSRGGTVCAVAFSGRNRGAQWLLSRQIAAAKAFTANGLSLDGAYTQFGTKNDPMVGRRVGGTITFGGGLGLYSGNTTIGGLGLSGDTACADHSTAWRLRDALGLTPATGNDRITLDNATGHPHCPNDAQTQGKN